MGLLAVGPDFWMGVVAGIFGTVIVVMVALNNLAKTVKSESKEDEEENERNAYWWNEGKRPKYEDE